MGGGFARLYRLSGPKEFLCENCGVAFFKRTLVAQILRAFLFAFTAIVTVVVILAFASVVIGHTR
jgi:hypothetical protein